VVIKTNRSDKTEIKKIFIDLKEYLIEEYIVNTECTAAFYGLP